MYCSRQAHCICIATRMLIAFISLFYFLFRPSNRCSLFCIPTALCGSHALRIQLLFTTLVDKFSISGLKEGPHRNAMFPPLLRRDAGNRSQR